MRAKVKTGGAVSAFSDTLDLVVDYPQAVDNFCAVKVWRAVYQIGTLSLTLSPS